jgi:hypothetical protein
MSVLLVASASNDDTIPQHLVLDVCITSIITSMLIDTNHCSPRQFDVLVPRAVIQHYHLSYLAHLRNKDLYLLQETHRNTLSFAISADFFAFLPSRMQLLLS